MSPVKIEPTQEQKDSEFGKMFLQEEGATRFKEGGLMKGKVIAILRDYVVVDIGFKSEGLVPISEFRGFSNEQPVKVGDEIEVMLEGGETNDGMIILSKEKADGLRVWDDLERLSSENGTVEGVIISKVKGGMIVDIGVKAFLPGSQIDIRPTRNLDDFVGMKEKFRIIKLNKKRGNVVLSRKALLEEERRVQRAETLSNISDGQIFDGIVKNITDYGVFVDLGGVDGLLHVTDMSWGRVNHPSEMFKVGDGIRVVVLKYDAESHKVSLGLKQLKPDPWMNVEDKFAVGSRVHGRVVNLTDYGAFISLEDGVEGLVHISEMSWSKKLKHPSKILSVGAEIDAVVLDIDMDNKRISLGLKQIMPNPWDQLENKFPLGTKVKGTIRNIADFGIFVDVGAEVDGMIHISDLDWVQNYETPAEVYNKNQEVEAVVLFIDPDKERFSLGIKQLKDDPWNKISSSFPEGSSSEGQVVKVTKTGYQVQLEDGVIGFVPKAKLKDELKEGASVTVKVVKANPEERKFHFSLE